MTNPVDVIYSTPLLCLIIADLWIFAWFLSFSFQEEKAVENGEVKEVEKEEEEKMEVDEDEQENKKVMEDLRIIMIG